MKNLAPYEKRLNDFFCNDYLTRENASLACNPHLHHHIEFVFLTRGSTVCHVDTETYTLREGDFLIVFPNQIHSFVSSGPENYLLFIVNPDLTPELEQQFGQFLPKTPVLRRVDRDERLVSLMRNLALFDTRKQNARTFEVEGDVREWKRFQDIARKGALLAFFGEVFSRLEWRDVSSANSDNRALRMIVKYCTKNFHKEMSLASLEEELHLSRYYISHIFSSRIGVRFNDYINSLRIAEACKYLRMSDLSITEISDLVGFRTPRTFNRAFNKQMNTSPKNYRDGTAAAGMSASIPM
ncbi:MAG: AraC family transcriptional regulator [Ruminococcaceae bacterium]|nr:AraC family transcriptional regulator [Oscillospiraceae bacterium]